MQPSVSSLHCGSISSQILGQFLAKTIIALLVSWSRPSSLTDINLGDRSVDKHLSLKWVWMEPNLRCISSKSAWVLRRKDNPLSEKANAVNSTPAMRCLWLYYLNVLSEVKCTMYLGNTDKIKENNLCSVIWANLDLIITIITETKSLNPTGYQKALFEQWMCHPWVIGQLHLNEFFPQHTCTCMSSIYSPKS